MSEAGPRIKIPDKLSSSRLGLIALVLLVVWGASLLWQGRLLPKGTVAPPWSLVVADGSHKKLSLKDLRGKVFGGPDEQARKHLFEAPAR